MRHRNHAKEYQRKIAIHGDDYRHARYLEEKKLWKHVTLRIDADVYDEIAESAAEFGNSVSEHLRCLIDWGMEETKK